MTWLIEMLGPENGSMVQPGSWLTPRTITESIGPWDESIDPSPDVDGEYFARAVLASSKIRKSTKGIVYYRKYRSFRSMSMQRSRKFLEGGVRSLNLISKIVLSKTDNPRAKKALARRYKEYAFSCYPYHSEVTSICLEKASALGYGEFKANFPTRTGRLICAIFGWKITKYLNSTYHKIKNLLEQK